MTRTDRLIEAKLNDSEAKGEAREAARQYFRELVREDVRLNDGGDPGDSVDSNEGIVLGFLKGYACCLNARA